MTDLPGVFSGIYTKGKQMSIIRDRMREIVPMDVDIPETEYQEYCFKEGNKYLIVGNNGSGKSKTLKTIFASASIKPPQICYLSQAAYLISGTIKENICLGLDYDEDKMNEILEIVCLTEEFSGSLLNLNTPVGNSGEQISGGQRKRIALARVLYRDPKVLILDDMTTGLDFKTEQKVMNNLKKLSSTIIISSSNQNLEKYVDVVVDITSEHKI
jgi:ABC-type multidrug transport system fused ATPase/permease subunit